MNEIIIINIFFAIMFSIPNITFAQDQANTHQVTINWSSIEEAPLTPLEEVQLPPLQLTDGSRGEIQTYLSMGENAPWDGILLNPAAAAFILAETHASYERARLALVRQRDSDTNRLQLEVGRLRLQINTDRAQANIVVDGLNRSIVRLQRIHSNYVNEQTGGFWRTKFGTVIKWGLVVLGSVSVGMVIGYIAHP